MLGYTIERYYRGQQFRKKRALRAEALAEWQEYVDHHDPGAEYALEAIAFAYDGYEGEDDNRDNLIVIRDHEGRLLGALSYFTDWYDRHKFRVSRMGVVKRHCGLGTILVRELAKIAAEQKMGICVIPGHDSEGFYKKIGMRKRGRGFRPGDHAFSAEKTKRFARNDTGSHPEVHRTRYRCPS